MQLELAQAYRLYFPLLVRKCARVLGNNHEAQDVAQDAFLRLSAAQDLDLGDGRALTAWLDRTSTRLAIDRLRVRSRYADGEGLEEEGNGVSPEHQVHVSRLLAALVRRVPEDELEVALLTHIDGLKQQEIAEVLGVHERSVRRLLSKFEERAARWRARSE